MNFLNDVQASLSFVGAGFWYIDDVRIQMFSCRDQIKCKRYGTLQNKEQV